MINNNILKFGYGDIAVGVDELQQCMKFQQFKPPTECGKRVYADVEWIGDEIKIYLNWEEYLEFNKLLEGVRCKNISVFDFKDYIFDFTNYNEKSIQTCKKFAELSMKWYILCLAA